VLLTFDDGPHAEVTPAVLDRLKRFDAHAAFFVVGERIAHAPSVLERMRAEGHLIGNHTYSHPLGRPPGLAAYLHDISRCQDAVHQQLGERPTLFRPPQGRISLGSVAAPRWLGLQTIYWSIDPADWRLRTRRAARAVGRRLTGEVGAGDIVLLHDDNPCVLTVLDVLLPALAEYGCDLGCGVEMLQPARGREQG
jgi:peptidoglycan/xylan/chitin deacetylase (PgdA/CDA1 family)